MHLYVNILSESVFHVYLQSNSKYSHVVKFLRRIRFACMRLVSHTLNVGFRRKIEWTLPRFCCYSRPIRTGTQYDFLWNCALKSLTIFETHSYYSTKKNMCMCIRRAFPYKHTHTRNEAKKFETAVGLLGKCVSLYHTMNNQFSIINVVVSLEVRGFGLNMNILTVLI